MDISCHPVVPYSVYNGSWGDTGEGMMYPNPVHVMYRKQNIYLSFSLRCHMGECNHKNIWRKNFLLRTKCKNIQRKSKCIQVMIFHCWMLKSNCQFLQPFYLTNQCLSVLSFMSKFRTYFLRYPEMEFCRMEWMVMIRNPEKMWLFLYDNYNNNILQNILEGVEERQRTWV